MPKVFISYRRDPDGPAVDGIDRRLGEAFGSRNVFRDVRGIRGGQDFPALLQHTARECDVLLAVIGKDWARVTGRSGGIRLHSPEDFVRREIEWALAHGVTVIPVLIDGADDLIADELPESLKVLSALHSVKVSSADSFDADMDQLVGDIWAAIRRRRPGWWPPDLGKIMAYVPLVLAVVAVILQVRMQYIAGDALALGVLLACLAVPVLSAGIRLVPRTWRDRLGTGEAFRFRLMGEEDMDQFVGRGHEKERLEELVRRKRKAVVVLSGTSGSGKSALLGVSFLPSLRDSGVTVVRVNGGYDAPGIALRQALLKNEKVKLFRRDDPSGTMEAFCENNRLLIVLDQFEQFFVYKRTPESQNEFLNILRSALNQDTLTVEQEKGEARVDGAREPGKDDPNRITNGNCQMIFVIRREWYTNLEPLQLLVPPLHESIFLRGLPDRDASSAIDAALKAHGGAGFSDELKDRIVRDLSVDGRIVPIHLRVLCHALEVNGLHYVGEYDKRGGREGVIGRFCEHLAKGTGDEQLAYRIFLALSMQRSARRALSVEEIRHVAFCHARDPQEANERVRSVLWDLVREGVVGRQGDRYQWVHDYFGAICREAAENKLSSVIVNNADFVSWAIIDSDRRDDRWQKIQSVSVDGVRGKTYWMAALLALGALVLGVRLFWPGGPWQRMLPGSPAFVDPPGPAHFDLHFLPRFAAGLVFALIVYHTHDKLLRRFPCCQKWREELLSASIAVASLAGFYVWLARPYLWPVVAGAVAVVMAVRIGMLGWRYRRASRQVFDRFWQYGCTKLAFAGAFLVGGLALFLLVREGGGQPGFASVESFVEAVYAFGAVVGMIYMWKIQFSRGSREDWFGLRVRGEVLVAEQHEAG